MLLVSWVAAVVACLGYGSASILQSVGARRVETASDVGGVAGIFRQAPYLIGLALDGVAFLGNVVALRELPLFLVQTIVTASVGVTAVLAFLRGTKLSRRDWGSLGLLVAGLVMLGASAAPESAVPVPRLAGWLVLAGGALPALVLLVGLRLQGRPSALVLATASGLGFSGVAIASRGLSTDSVSFGMLADPLLWAVVVHGVLALAAFALALQRGAVTTVTAITFMVELVLPSAVGLLIFGDQVMPGLLPLAVAGFVVSVVGTVSLLRFAS